ncbi:MAG TPA: alpha/beta hydrolase [Alphaproteobacteria bacterium]|nr:alpha/beta hydrolase [Alphaproteobacteria bacterium]
MYALHVTKKEPRYDFFFSLTPEGFRKIAYVEWGNADNPRVLICAHGLTRNSRDFDFLARDLEHNYRIVCPDLLGRGESDYLGSPLFYNLTQYMSDMIALIARLSAHEIHWLGTSLGGIIGMMLAAQPNSPIKSLILNDVGMIIPSLALRRLGTYARNDNSFLSFQEAKNYFQTILAPFGIHEAEQWDHITQYGIKRDEKGDFRLNYDPVIGQHLVDDSAPSLHLEAYWQAIRCPIMILRGADSDFLLPEIVTKMLYSQPKAKVVTIPNCGHAPSLMAQDQIKIVEEWLKEV